MKSWIKILFVSLFLLLTSCGTMTYVRPTDTDRYYRYYYYYQPYHDMYLDGMYNPYDYNYYYYYRSYPQMNYAPSYQDHVNRGTTTPAPTQAPSRRETTQPSRRETPPNSTSTPPPNKETTKPPARR